MPAQPKHTAKLLARRRLLAGVTVLSGAAVIGSASAAAGAAPTVAADGDVHLPARVVAPPTSISEAARAFLANSANQPFVAPPPAGDVAAWRRAVGERDARLLSMMGPGVTLPGLSVETRNMGGATVYVVRHLDGNPAHARPHLSIHGGGWTNLGGSIARVLGQVTAQNFGGTVFAVDYRQPPDHRYPAPLDDCLAAYREVLKLYAPEKILVEGGSAGGNLAAALMLKARDAGLPPPGALFLDTPITDMTGAGDTLQTNQYLDVRLKVWTPQNYGVYAGDARLDHPYLSPLKGDLSRGFPPTYLRSGTRDLFLSDTVRFHAALRTAGVEADLYVGEAMPHAGFSSSTPEDLDARADLLRWLSHHWIP